MRAERSPGEKRNRSPTLSHPASIRPTTTRRTQQSDNILFDRRSAGEFANHAGVFDLREEAQSTEELWFPIWEFGGMPWDNPEVYDRWSPSHFVKEFQTPTLVIHGELDFRIPYTQGLELYTTLQMRKVPSQLLIFPDEGHWVLKPQNSELWYKTFLDWVGNWTKK